MGFLIAASQSRSAEELKNALRSVRVIGSVRESGPWWWAHVLHLHFKELHAALSSYESCSLAAYAGDGAWKLTLFARDRTPFSLWFDASLATERGIEKAKIFYEENSAKLAKQFGLSKEEEELLRFLPFEEAVSRLLELQLTKLVDAFQQFSIPHDPITIRETLLNPTPDELDSELGNLPRFLERIGITGLLD
jgi:hypothetical protein